MRKLIKHFNLRDYISIILIAIGVLCQVYFDLKLPDYMSEITMLTQTPESTTSQIINAGFSMLLCAVTSLLFAVIVAYFAARFGARFSVKLRELIFNKVESFSMQEINSFSTSSLINRTTNDITAIQMLISMGLQLMIKAPVMAIFAVIKIYNKNFTWTLVTGVAVSILLIIISLVVVIAVPRFKKTQMFTDQISKIARENLLGIRVVHAYNAENYQNDKFEKVNQDLTHNTLVANRAMSVINPTMTLISNALNLGIYFAGAVIISQAVIGPERYILFSDMVVFMSYAMQIVVAFMLMTFMIIQLPKAAVSAKRVAEVLDTKPRIIFPDKTKSTPTSTGTVEFKNVSFKYPDAEEAVLENISFSANLGETIAFIGSAGSGKSTLVNLIARFYDVTEGEILLDGINITDYSQADLYDKIGYVPQTAVIFKSTIKDNISYGEKISADMTDIDLAIDISQSREFVSNTENGVDSETAQNGKNLSGGQRQRVAIARAIARNPEFYIFDDSFSALDYKTDRVLRTELKKHTNSSTKFIVAQRINTIRDADKIVVLDQGKVMGIGSHSELLESCQVYSEIAHSQLSKEEL